MLFGMKNSLATFQRLVNSLISNLAGCKAYIDDAIIFSEEWEQHLQTIKNFFDRLSEATLTVKAAYSVTMNIFRKKLFSFKINCKSRIKLCFHNKNV